MAYTNMVSIRHLHRYLVALPQGDRTVHLSWRLLETDRAGEAFFVERRHGDGENWQRLNSVPVLDSTNYLDRAPEASRYEYRILSDDGQPSEIVSVDAGGLPSSLALDVPLNPQDGVGGIALGDLQNDQLTGYVLRLIRGGTIWIAAYAHRGKHLWEFDTHIPARGGWDGSTLHVPYLAWDVNGDGRTEVAFHSYRGTYPRELYSEAIPGEHLSVVDGETGDLVWETAWPAIKSRVMMTVGHLHGLDRPGSIVVLDETYGDVTLTALDGKTGQVAWQVDQARPAGHNLDIGDIDEDGVQEVICGGVCYRGDGTVCWQAEPFGHTDISKPCKIDPARQGLQIWYAVEKHNPGVYLVDRDGQTIFKEPFRHAHYGWIARHAPGVPGLHPHAAEDARHKVSGAGQDVREKGHFPIFLPDGTHWLNLTDWQRKNFVPVHWDEGPTVVFCLRKESKRLVRLLASGEIEDLPGGKLPEGARLGRNLACADVVGDMRENIVTVDEERQHLIVLANPTLARHRGYSPYEDFAYRHDRSQHGSGYYIYLSPPDTVVNR